MKELSLWLLVFIAAIVAINHERLQNMESSCTLTYITEAAK